MSKLTFTVQGTGIFPFDMLRYDECYPATSEDAVKLSPHIKSEMYRNPRTVKLCINRKPTVARWESFGWKII